MSGSRRNKAAWVRCVIFGAVLIAARGSIATAQESRPTWANSFAPGIADTDSDIQQAIYVPQTRLLEMSETVEAEQPDLTRAEKLDAFAAQLPDGDSGLIQFIEVLQWLIVVCIVAVVAALALKRFRPQGITLPGQSSLITHLGSLPVKNHFYAHLLEIENQQFLVTTDRGGVKTVNPLTRWDAFEAPVEDEA